MKKVVLSIALFASMSSFAQKTTSKFNYKIGFVTPLPTDLNSSTPQIGLGSTMGEVTYRVSEKIVAAGNVGYIRFNNQDANFSQIPVTVGARYIINEQFYFGANAGLASYNKGGHTDFIYSPYLGIQLNKISVDFRYFNTVKPESIRVVGLVFSYSL